MRLLGREAVDTVVLKFMAILGTDATCLFKEGFCETSGCPPEKLRDFLGAKWNHDRAGRVARLEETASPFPVLLIRRQGSIYSLQVWSPKDFGDALIVVPGTQELSNKDMAKLMAILGGPSKVSMCEESGVLRPVPLPPF